MASRAEDEATFLGTLRFQSRYVTFDDMEQNLVDGTQAAPDTPQSLAAHCPNLMLDLHLPRRASRLRDCPTQSAVSGRSAGCGARQP